MTNKLTDEQYKIVENSIRVHSENGAVQTAEAVRLLLALHDAYHDAPVVAVIPISPTGRRDPVSEAQNEPDDEAAGWTEIELIARGDAK